MCEDKRTTEKANSNPATTLAGPEVAMTYNKIADGSVAKENDAAGNDVRKWAGNNPSPPICDAVNVAHGTNVTHSKISSK